MIGEEGIRTTDGPTDLAQNTGESVDPGALFLPESHVRNSGGSGERRVSLLY
jgi:hypothetical protein